MGRMGFAGAILIVWFVLGALMGGVGVWLGRRIWKRRKTAPAATTIVQSLIALSILVGGIGTLVGLVKAFGAVGGESVDPSQKARILAEGIAEAMNCTALGLVVGVTGLVVAGVMARLRKRSE